MIENHYTIEVIRLSVVLEFRLLFGLDDGNSFHKVSVQDGVGSSPQGDHTGLDANSLDHGTVEVLSGPGNLSEVDLLLRHVHLSGMDLQDLDSGILSWQREFDFTIQSS